MDQPVARCRLCGSEVLRGAHRCPFCGVARPAPAPKSRSAAPATPPLEPRPVTAPRPRDDGRVTRARVTKPVEAADVEPGSNAGDRGAQGRHFAGLTDPESLPAGDTTADEDEALFAPGDPLQRVHGKRGKLTLWAFLLGGLFLTLFGATSLISPGGSTSADMNLFILATGLGSLATAHGIGRWKPLGYYGPMGAMGLAAALQLFDLVYRPWTWFPALLVLGFLGFFASYFQGRKKLFFGERDPLADVRVPRPFRGSAYLQADEAMYANPDRVSRANALIAINNHIARAGSVEKTSIEKIRGIPRQFNLTLAGMEKERRALYRAYLLHFVKDGSLNARDLKELERLADMLVLSPKAIAEVRGSLAKRLYRWRARKALRDGRIDAAERAEMASLQAELEVSDADAGAIRAELVSARMERLGATAALSAAERHEAKALALAAGASLPDGEPTRAALERLRLREVLEREELPRVKPLAALDEGEACHALREVTSYHLTRPDVDARLHALAPRIDPSVWGGDEPDRELEVPDDAEVIASGHLHLTSRRLILSNRHGQDALELADVREVGIYANGVELRMASGVALFMAFADQVEEFAMLLDRAARARRSASPSDSADEAEHDPSPLMVEVDDALAAAAEDVPLVDDSDVRKEMA